MNTIDLKNLTEAYHSVLVENSLSKYVEIIVSNGKHAEDVHDIFNATSIEDAVYRVAKHLKSMQNIDSELVHSFVEDDLGVVTASMGGFSIIVPESKVRRAQTPGFIERVRSHFDLPVSDFDKSNYNT